MISELRLQGTFTKKDGLADETVTVMLEDSKGNLWFGTTNGLSRYDGKRFKNFTTKDGLAANVIGAIFEDRNGNLWFGTGKWDADGSGVSRYDGKTFKNFSAKDGLAGNTVMDIFEDKAGNLWFATRDGGVSRYDGKTFHNIKSGFAHNEDWPHDSYVSAITQDTEGNLWFGCYGGISCYNGRTFRHFTTDDGLQSGWIGALMFDKKGNLWISRGGGGGYLSSVDSKFQSELDNSKRTSKALRRALEDNGILISQSAAVFIRHKGSSWLINDKLLFSAGLDFLIYPKTFRQEFEKNGLPLARDVDFVGYVDIEWMIVDKDNKVVYFIIKDKDKLNVYQRSYTVVNMGNKLRIGGRGGGLSRYDGKTFINFASNDGLPGDIVHSIMQDTKGNFWFGTIYGASVYDGKSFRNFNTKHGLAHNVILKIVEDRNGTLWFATLGGGVSFGVVATSK